MVSSLSAMLAVHLPGLRSPSKTTVSSIKQIPNSLSQARNAYGVTTGSYQYVDANGLVQTVNYIADDVNGFRVQGTNLPVAGLAAPVFDGVQAPAPVFTGVQAPAPVFEGVQIADTEEVAAAKAAFAEAYAAQEAAVAAAPAERKRRSAQVVAAGLPLPYAHGLVSPLAAAAPASIVANIAHATPEVVAPAAVTYAAGAVPVAAAAPSREAVLTTVKLNPGHAVFYRVD